MTPLLDEQERRFYEMGLIHRLMPLSFRPGERKASPMRVFYRQSEVSQEGLFAAFIMNCDFEITLFRDGRDLTFKGLAGDHLVLQQTPDGDWIPMDTMQDDDMDEDFIPVANPEVTP